MTATEIHEFLTSRPSKPAMRLLLKEEFNINTYNPTMASMEAFLLDRMVELKEQG